MRIPVKTVVGARVPPALKEAIDDAAARLGLRRSQYICNTLYLATTQPPGGLFAGINIQEKA